MADASPPPDEALPDDLMSLSINEAHRRTGIPITTLYDLMNANRIETYVLGRRRFVIARSLRQLIAELQANTPPLHRHRRFGRNAPPKATSADQSAALTGAAAPAAGQAPRRISRLNTNAAGENAEGSRRVSDPRQQRIEVALKREQRSAKQKPPPDGRAEAT